MDLKNFLLVLLILAVVAAVVVVLTNSVRSSGDDAPNVEGFYAKGVADDADDATASLETGYPTNPPPSQTNTGMHSPATQADETNEHVADVPSPAAASAAVGATCSTDYTASEPLGQNETFKFIGSEEKGSPTTLPKDCFPKDQLSPSELLPGDANSTWAQVNPAGQGDLRDKNFLAAGQHVGINTVGQTLRNANMQLRSEPPNPQVKVAPWNQTTIEPDSNRRPMEIGGC